MNDERIDDYLAAIDAQTAAPDLFPFPLSFDEWNAIRATTGQARGDFWQYLTELDRAGTRRSYDALTYFGAIDDDDYVPFIPGE